MIEILIYIPGPVFLFLFVGLAIVCIVIGRWRANADDSLEYPMPAPDRFSTYEIAALRGKENAVIRTAVFSLWKRNLLTIKGEGKDVTIESTPMKKQPLDSVEKPIRRFLEKPQKPRDLFKDSSLTDQVRSYLFATYRNLELLHLIRSSSDRARAWSITLITALILGTVGGIKLYHVIIRSRPVVFLFILLIISLIAVFKIIKPGKDITKLGSEYLKSLEKHFGWLKDSVKENPAPEGIDPALAAAIFGIGVFDGISQYNAFNEAFPVKKTGGSGGECGGGCGGGCGGCG
ncbi:MAG: TIGR04222 domain-containing membrane protein [Desulfobacteraceae bacterium]|nr:TIGR04222 domain-containing membrane protein [Desulfobacteraceae bacterium]